MKNNLIQINMFRKPVYFPTILNWFLIIGAIVLFGSNLEAQQETNISSDAMLPVVKMDLAPPNEHKLHPYVNEEKFIYWPQDKPIFFWLGTSSDENAQLFPLLHSGTMNSDGHWKPDTANELENYRSDGLKLEISLFVGYITTTKKKQQCASLLTEFHQ